NGRFAVPEGTLEAIRRDFDAGRATIDETATTIRTVLSTTGYLLDPHTATAIKVARGTERSEVPMVVLSTAHPAKFPAAVEAASGVRPALPTWLGDLMNRQERFT